MPKKNNSNWRNYQNKSQQQRKEPALPPRRKGPLLAGISELKYQRDGVGPGTNWDTWSTAVKLYCEKTYGLLGSCLRNDEYPEHPTFEEGEAYEDDDFTPENDPHGIKKSALLIDMKITASERAAEVKNKPAMFATICSQISDDSEEAVRCHHTWPEFGPAATDVLQLWRALRDTHVIAAVGVAMIDSTRARKTYNSLI